MLGGSGGDGGSGFSGKMGEEELSVSRGKRRRLGAGNSLGSLSLWTTKGDEEEVWLELYATGGDGGRGGF